MLGSHPHYVSSQVIQEEKGVTMVTTAGEAKKGLKLRNAVTTANPRSAHNPTHLHNTTQQHHTPTHDDPITTLITL